MTIRRRLAARALRLAAGAASASLLLAWPLAGSASADNLTVDIESPAEGARFSSSNTVGVSGTVTPSPLTTVSRIDIEILTADGAVADRALVCTNCGQEPVPFNRGFTLPKNGGYQVRVTASGTFLAGLPLEDVVATRSFAVGVPAAAPTGLTAEALLDGKVKLTWNAVPQYPDFIGYIVYRARPGADFEAPFHGVRETFLVDDSAGAIGGRLQYVVAAVRSGAAPGTANWLQSRSSVATIDVPAPTPPAGPAGPGGETTTTTLPTGAVPAGPALPSASNLDLGGFFGSTSSSASLPTPSATSSLELPDTGFSSTLPFPGDLTPKVDGRQPGRPSSAAGTGELEDGTADGLPDSNRRALLVPVAAGSVLCVAALHLRWLSRRLVVAPATAGFGAGDLEHTDFDFDPDAHDFADDREPVGAGVGAGGPYSST